MTCGSCDNTDGQCYCSLPPKVKCTISGKFHYYDDKCDIEFKPVTYSYWVHSIVEDEDWGGTFHTFKCYKCGWKTQTNPSGCFTYCPGCGSLIFDSEEIMNDMKGK